MGKILAFAKLKIGEILTMEVKGQSFKCEVLSNEENNVYKLRILEGEYRGKFLYFEMINFEDRRYE